METYQKIQTLYKRYIFDSKECPSPKWLKFKNNIILGDFSNIEAKYLFDCQWEAYSKIDGINSKIIFFPSTQEIKVGGKTDNASSMHGQFEMLQEISDRIKPQLCEMFPKECARFAPVKNVETNKVQYYDTYADNGASEDIDDYDVFFTKAEPKDINKQSFWGVQLEEVPVYIYGEYYGEGIQKCGKRYIAKGNNFKVFDICQQGWWTPKEVRDGICTELSLDTVPYIGNMTLRDIEKMVKEGFPTKINEASDPTLIEEGIVARPIVPLKNNKGERIIVKVKYRDYKKLSDVMKEFTDEEFAAFEAWYKEHSNDN